MKQVEPASARAKPFHIGTKLWTERVGALVPPLADAWLPEQVREALLLSKQQGLFSCTDARRIPQRVKNVKVGEQEHIESCPLNLGQGASIRRA